VFVPESDPPARPPAAGPQAVKEALSSGVKKPSDYSHAAMVYDYDRDFVYEVYAQPLRVCDIVLEPGERAVEAPFVSDSERWILGAGVSYENGTAVQHIYVKPAASGQEASLIINTDRRVYYVILRSYKDAHMPIIRWRYFSGLPANYHSPQPKTNSDDAGADPRFISFNYRITYGLFKKPAWLPTLVFDDGSKTYVTFPELVLQRELPSVFENRSGVLNYRVSGNVIIIDKLIENITVKIERNEITIAKKRGADVR
jgi:type IV secretion system protein VirB9